MASASYASADPFGPARAAAIEAVNADSAGQKDRAVHAYETAAHLIRTAASCEFPENPPEVQRLSFF
jgi:hypothetical protein